MISKLTRREILEGYTNWSEKCATECPKLILGREHPLQFRFILNTDNVLVGQYVIPNRETGFPTIKDAYTRKSSILKNRIRAIVIKILFVTYLKI